MEKRTETTVNCSRRTWIFPSFSFTSIRFNLSQFISGYVLYTVYPVSHSLMSKGKRRLLNFLIPARAIPSRRR